MNITAFIALLTGDQEGYLSLASLNPKTAYWDEVFVPWPKEQEEAVKYIGRNYKALNMYFCPTILRTDKRTKDQVLQVKCLWSDLDECHPEHLKVPPSLVMETSPKRYQAYWLLNDYVDPLEAEAVNKAIAYAHADQGADKSGWDLTQMLRIPGSNNFKYFPEVHKITPKAKLSDPDRKYDLSDFDVYGVEEIKTAEYDEVPTKLPDPQDVLTRVAGSLSPHVRKLFEEPPASDWSKALWSLELGLFTVGCSKEEVFAVAKAAACNKYKRDGRPETLLWKEIVRAADAEETSQVFTLDESELAEAGSKRTPLLSEEERAACKETSTIVEDYIEWGKSVGDAAWQYHQAGAFTILSSLLCGSVRLPTSFGDYYPNLWFMILADTTLTRKTTAMKMAMKIVDDIDPDAQLANDGSIEGLLTSLATRPGRPSVFLRDEISGFLKSMIKKDYLSGMMEQITKLYDGDSQKRELRKETIDVRDPRFLFFAGGIKDTTLELLGREHISSGFVPRFIFITAESDITKLKPMGPRTTKSEEQRDALVERFRRIYQHYNQPAEDNEKGMTLKLGFDAELTEDAWLRYNDINTMMAKDATESAQATLMVPMMARLAINGLKVAVLIAASRCESPVTVTLDDIVRAFYYVEQWREHSYLIVENAGRTTTERRMEMIRAAIERKPGVQRSELMRSYHLDARTADMYFATLEQRGEVTSKKEGRATTFRPVRT